MGLFTPDLSCITFRIADFNLLINRVSRKFVSTLPSAVKIFLKTRFILQKILTHGLINQIRMRDSRLSIKLNRGLYLFQIFERRFGNYLTAVTRDLISFTNKKRTECRKGPINFSELEKNIPLLPFGKPRYIIRPSEIKIARSVKPIIFHL